MTPETQVAVARLGVLADALVATGEAGPFLSAQAIRLLLAEVRHLSAVAEAAGPLEDAADFFAGANAASARATVAAIGVALRGLRDARHASAGGRDHVEVVAQEVARG